MPLDDDPDDDRPTPDQLLPPDDRLWRHPSEIAAAASPDAGAPSVRVDRRVPARTALAGACLAGAVVAFGAMWIARPTRVVEGERPPQTIRTAVTAQTAAFSGTVPTQMLAVRMGSSVAQLRVERDGRWTNGSALWVDDRGTLAVAAPTVAGASGIVVVGDDQTSLTARLVGTDSATGVSALVVDRTAGTPVTLATTTLRAGGPAAVVGATGTDAGEDNGDATVAVVVVRSVSLRATVGDNVVHDAIQLDRSVPTDAHGGALVDVDGGLLGMVVGNSSERSLGAVAPGAAVMTSATDLRDHGKVNRAWLGVRAVDLDPDDADLLGVPGGARLVEITDGSPADAAGLQAGDVVVSIDEHTVDDASDLVKQLATYQPGDRAVVHVRRGTADLDLPVDLGG